MPTRWRWPAGPSATRAGVDTQQCSLRDTFERLSQEQMQRIEKLLQLVELLRAFPDPMCWHPAMMGVPGQLHFLALECVGLLAPACTCPPVFAHGLWAGMAHFLRWRLVCLVFVMMPPTQDRADAVTLPARLILAWGGGFSESHLTASRTGLQRRFSAGPPVPPRARSPVTGDSTSVGNCWGFLTSFPSRTAACDIRPAHGSQTKHTDPSPPATTVPKSPLATGVLPDLSSRSKA